MSTENYPLPKANAWPRVRSLLDQALDSPRGISATFPSWTDAEKARAAAYKIRDRQRAQSRKTFPDPEDPRHGVSSYDGISMSLKSSLDRRNQEIIFHNLANHTEDEIQALQEAAKEFLSSDPWGRQSEQENPFPNHTVTIKVKVPDQLGFEDQDFPVEVEKTSACHLAVVRFAPSYQEGWALLRRDFPCRLILENGYDTSHLQVEQI